MLDNEDHALWLAVVKEHDTAACQKIVDQWKVEHKRRRNLWKVIRTKTKLPV
jgi:hypothetical protein